MPLQLRSTAATRLVFAGPSHLGSPAPPFDVGAMTTWRLGSSYSHYVDWESNSGFGVLADEWWRWGSKVRNYPGCTDVLVMAPNPADLFVPTPSAQDAYDAHVAFAELGRAAGFDYVVAATPPIYAGYGVSSEIDAQLDERADLITLLVANGDSAFDVVVRCDGGDFEDVSSDYFSSDTIHLALPGGIAVAALLAAGISTTLP